MRQKLCAAYSSIISLLPPELVPQNKIETITSMSVYYNTDLDILTLNQARTEKAAETKIMRMLFTRSHTKYLQTAVDGTRKPKC
jgi:hypothetical protein